MKLLFDQNLSQKLVSLLADLFPGSQHVRNLGMREAADPEIAAYAKQNGFAVVTKDSDFLLHAYGHSQVKVIWLQLPNCRTSRVHEVLRRHAIRVSEFWGDPRATLLTIM